MMMREHRRDGGVGARNGEERERERESKRDKENSTIHASIDK